MKRIIVSFLSCSFFLIVQAQESVSLINISTIPASLKENADVIYRLDEGTLEVLSPSEYTLKVHQVVTILNENGQHYLNHELFTDKFNKVKEVTIIVFDALGLQRKSYNIKDFETEAAFDGISIYTDDKVLTLYTPAPGYPCTIDVQYKLQASGYVELPNWFIDYNRASTEIFRYDVKVPAALDIRFRTVNLNTHPKVDTTGNIKHYVWETRNVTAKAVEKDTYEAAYYLPQVEISPTEFNYDGYQGSLRTWKDFGEWNYTLYEEKAPFSQKRIDEIKSLIKTAADQKERISILYKYLQQNMRYVSIQLGIGGFKPFSVKFVDEKKYGDCKALTNYMRNLLKVAGIDSYPALINAGVNKVPADPGFPNDPFNHVILCIPGEKDTTWLECTSVHKKSGELGTFTENKKALLLTEHGGVLVNTPKSNYLENQVITKNQVIIDADGGAEIKNRIRSKGESASFYYYLSQMKEDEQHELLVKTFHYKHPDDMSVSFVEDMYETIVQVNRTNNKLYDLKSGNKYFFPLCINKLVIKPIEEGIRKSDFLFDFPYVKTDTTVYLLPEGYLPESIPSDKELLSDYSSYKRNCTYTAEKGQLVIISSLSLKNHVIPAGEYLQVAQFFTDVMKAEDENFVLIKK
jgi:hypothetical protein